MKSKQVLSIKQMKHLQDLGLDTSDASMVLIAIDDDSCTLDWETALEAMSTHLYDVSFDLFDADSSYYDHSYRKDCGVFTLQDILDKLPPFIGNNTLTLQRHGDKWMCLYIEPYTRYSLHMEIKEKCIYAAYHMLCWCIENGYIGKEGE